MSQNTPSGQPANAKGETPAAPTSDEQLRGFWFKNKNKLILLCVILIVAAAGYSFYEKLENDKTGELGAAYAAANTPEKLKAFASANAGTTLGNVALLDIADKAYEAKQYADATAAYEKAAAAFKTGIYAGRAQLGVASSKALAGQASDAEAKFKQISGDHTQLAVVRAEAAYHQATLAAAAGRTDDALKIYEQVATIDPSSNWASFADHQRTTLMAGNRTGVVPAAATAPADQAPVISFPGTK